MFKKGFHFIVILSRYMWDKLYRVIKFTKKYLNSYDILCLSTSFLITFLFLVMTFIASSVYKQLPMGDTEASSYTLGWTDDSMTDTLASKSWKETQTYFKENDISFVVLSEGDVRNIYSKVGVKSKVESNIIPLIVDISVKKSKSSQIELYLKNSKIEYISHSSFYNHSHRIGKVIFGMSIGLIALMLIVFFLFLSYVIHMTFKNREDEIRMLSLMGASDRYIQHRFLYKMVLYMLSGIVLGIFISSLGIGIIRTSILYLSPDLSTGTVYYVWSILSILSMILMILFSVYYRTKKMLIRFDK
ncbi:MAG: hypothetical protein JJV93_01070 [Alphaproteobacteria bacterium]|nr:hypothetical protein [Alphaproteobacteria bacterium]MBL0717843.1 hypothetical protein [Alphaproteobacteria bacterium]